MERSVAAVLVAVSIILVLAPGAIGTAAADDVTLTTTVVDSDGDAVGGLDLTVTWNGDSGGPENYTTAANGQALIDVPDGADVQIRVVDDRYVRNRPFLVTNAQSGEIEIPVSLSGRATITALGPSGPVSDASVELSRNGRSVEQLTTDTDGTATTERIERGTYDVRTTRGGFLTNTTTIDVTGTVEQTIRLERGRVDAQFTVVDSYFEDPRPIDNATIRLPELGTTLTTFGGGTASTGVPVNREYDVVVSKDGYRTARQTLSVAEERASITVDIRRTPSITVEADESRELVGNSVEVVVTDEYDDPVENALIRVGGKTVATTDADGRAEVPIRTAGTVSIAATTGDRSATTTVEGVEAAAEETTSAPETTASPTTAAPETTADESPPQTTGTSGPGFGAIAAIGALLAFVAFGRFHR